MNNEDADIVLLMEINKKWVRELTGVAAHYPDRLILPRSDNFGIAMLTRLPVKRLEVIEPGTAGVPSIFLEALAGQQTVRFLGTRPLPPSGYDYSTAREAQLEDLVRFMAPDNRPT